MNRQMSGRFRERYSFRNTEKRKLAEELRKLRALEKPISQQLTRTNSGIRDIYEKSVLTGAYRRDVEEARVMEQCVAVILPPVLSDTPPPPSPVDPGSSEAPQLTKCWLCGFYVQGLDNPVTRLGNFFWSAFMDSAVCEHVLPVRLASVITGLYTTWGGIPTVGNEHLLHSVYEYAHIFCNLAKSNMWFISKPNKATPDYCDLVVNEKKIDFFLEKLYNHTISGARPGDYRMDGDRRVGLDVYKHESGIFLFENKEPKRVFDNLVQMYIYQSYSPFVPDGDKQKMKEMWKVRQKAYIIEKSVRLIKKIQAEDGCGTSTQGNLYKSTMEALDALAQTKTLPKIYGPMRVFARSPSIESVNRQFALEGRAHPRIMPTIRENIERNLTRSALDRIVSTENVMGLMYPDYTAQMMTSRNLVRHARSRKPKRKYMRRGEGKRKRKGARTLKIFRLK